ncbi:MAG TPA: DUF87 domain-containing protein [Candidatus Saccharibacteria bacterium]|nr:DUF87 domain-containing protein [Candidatus Saccharibacteria bacterium]HRK94619.1 DUF87 domain-containing protein [Candidatus Saccharibacteria bacterium]
MIGAFIGIFVVVLLVLLAGAFVFVMYQRTLREAKNYERGLKMVPMLIHLPPSSDDLDTGGRDERDVTEEVLSQAQVMYNIIASTAMKGFKSRIYGQRHLSFEIVARDGLVHYYTVVPVVLVDVIRQAIAAAYPSARLEEVEEHVIFNEVGKISGTIGGEFTLKKDYVYPIATYQDSKRDASRALLNALSAAGREDGIGVQILIRPAREGWTKKSVSEADKIAKEKGQKGGVAGFSAPKDIMEALWKPPESTEEKRKENPEDHQLTSLEKAKVEAIEEKTRYPGYETLIRVVVSSNTAAQSQTLLKNVISAFALFDSPSYNGFKFAVSRNIEELVTAYIFRFFPQSVNSSILNTIELATLFHLPDQKNIPTSQVQRQMSKQVDGPTQLMDEGFLLGYNEFRGTKKPIRLSTNDRRRHTYIIGQTGTGKSVLLENLAFQDMMDGKGFAFVDPHGDSVEALLGKVPKERVEDIIYFNPGDMANPIGLNMFEFDHEDQKDFLVQEAINMLYGLYDPGHTGIVGPRLEHIFRNSALLLMADPAGGTFVDIPKVLIDPDFMKSKLKYVKDQSVLDFWTKEFPASQRSNEAGEVISWVVSKFGPFISNDAMRNIIGQTKSGFNLRDIMDNKKILLVNLSKGKMGELNSKLMGMIFVMKFQAAAMGRANVPESERVDFSLYVDEFQNFATDSFESILSEARKYRLNLILGNQFMTQLTDKVREAIIGNVGTVISGRIGITDAEILVKKFAPTFDAEDLTKMPNYQSITSVMINNVPSAPFSMSFVPPMGQSNPQLADALKRLSAAKHGKPRAVVEKEIFARLGAAEKAKQDRLEQMKKLQQNRPGATGVRGAPKPSGSSFLDEWLAKRQQLGNSKPGQLQSTPPASSPQAPGASPAPLVPPATDSEPLNAQASAATPPAQPVPSQSEEPVGASDKLHLRGDDKNDDSEVAVKLR